MTMQQGFVFDINKCTGCQACAIACEIENELEPGANWRQVTTFNDGHVPGVLSFHLSIACNHCVDAPCMKNCPALAYSKDPATGAVTINPDQCIGCRYCAWACPYDAPRFSHEKGVVEKCTFCDHRLAEGLTPACVTSCPTGALTLGEHRYGFRNKPVPGFPSAEAEPAIRFIPLEAGRELPEANMPEAVATAPRRESERSSNVTLRGEWVLVAFTLIVAGLLGAFVTMRDAGRGDALIYLACGAVGMVATTLHLGRWERAYRAVLNWRGSWLSREIILVSAFLGLSFVSLFFGIAGEAGRGMAVVLGIAALYAIDRVYHVAGTQGLGAHSAQTLLTGFLFVGLFSGDPLRAGVVVAIKLVLYVIRKQRFASERRPLRPALSALRVTLGVLVPAVLWAAMLQGSDGSALWPVIVAAVLAGEVIDRCEFYMELDVPTLPAVSNRDLSGEIAARAQARA